LGTINCRVHQDLYNTPSSNIERGKGDDVLMSIEGFANYVAMVNPAKGSDFLAQVKRIKKLYGKRQR
jgi:hypothetical protein